MVLQRVLLVDDSAATNALNKRLLEKNQLAKQVDVALNGKEAIDYLIGAKHQGNPPIPEVILLDIEMEGSDGFSFLEEYAQLDQRYTNNKSIVIAVLSKYIDRRSYFERSKLYRDNGVLDRIKKPLEMDDFEELIAEHFE